METSGPTGIESTDTGATGIESTDTGATGTGPTGDIGTGPTGMYMMYQITPPLPEILTMSDLMTDRQIVVAKEVTDKALLNTIGVQSVHSLRPLLVQWVMNGCPNAYPLLKLDIRPPEKCSDGECRCLTDYIEFCSGKSIQEHTALLQAKLPDIVVSFANIGGVVTIVVSKSDA